VANDIATRLRHAAWLAPEGEPWADQLREAADEIEYLRQICEELSHAIECPNPACTLDWDGIHNWHDYRDQLAGRNKDTP
jgi:hypothetical protein